MRFFTVSSLAWSSSTISRLDLLLVLPMIDADADCFWMAEDAASVVGAISSGGRTEVRCFFFGGVFWTSSSTLLLLLEEVELAEDSPVVMMIVLASIVARGVLGGEGVKIQRERRPQRAQT